MKNTLTFLFLTGTLATHAQVCLNTATPHWVSAHKQHGLTVDLDGDGKLDIATVSYTGDFLTIRMGTGAGTFVSGPSGTGFIPVGNEPRWVASGDFNEDAIPDIVVANHGANNVSVLLGTGTGAFSSTTHFTAGSFPMAVVTGDFNADTHLDLAVVNGSSENISILLGNGAGSFATAVNYPVSGSYPYSITTADFNGDGVFDLATPIFNSDNISVLMGTGTGTFGAAVNYVAGDSPIALVSADFNGDGKNDIASVNAGTDNASVFINAGSGIFATAVNYYIGNEPYGVTTGDFSGDGILDLVAANFSGSTNNIHVIKGSGTGTFAAPVIFSADQLPISVFAGDFNGDGKTDLASTNYNDGMSGVSNLSIFLNCAISTLGTDEVGNETAVNIYPNPTNGIVTVNASKNIEHIKVYNVTGENIYTAAANTSTSTLDLNLYPAGVYFVEVKTVEGMVRQKLVKE